MNSKVQIQVIILHICLTHRFKSVFPSFKNTNGFPSISGIENYKSCVKIVYSKLMSEIAKVSFSPFVLNEIIEDTYFHLEMDMDLHQILPS